MEKAEIQSLIRAAFEGQKFAYVPYSRFHVGAALLGKNGEPLTNHTTFDVFCFVLTSDKRRLDLAHGGLSNVAPSVLKLMELEIPQSMDKALF